MANGKIKAIKRNVYKIDIEDEEDNVIHTLSFNLDDINFPVKAVEFVEDVKKSFKEIGEKEEELKQDILNEDVSEVEEIENITIENIDKVEIPAVAKKFFYMQADAFNALREIMDNFLGKGTCNAVFGDVNSVSMFEEFISGLVPEFEKMGVKMVKVQENLYKKHAPKNKKDNSVLR